MAVDLHTHSNASDGTDSPAQVVAAAAEAGLLTVALTDHDSTAGLQAARAEGARRRIEVIPGVELSLQWAHGTMHILVYFVEPGDDEVEDALARLRAGRHDRNRRIVADLIAGGVDITYDEVLRFAGEAAVGRPHIARLLIEKGVAADMQQTFDEILGTRGWAYRSRVRITVDQLRGLIRNGDRVAVLAHPHTVGFGDDWDLVMDALASLPVAGVEVYYPGYEPARRRRLLDAVRAAGLIWTGGSDYHGDNKPQISIGTGLGDLEVPDRCAEMLHETRA